MTSLDLVSRALPKEFEGYRIVQLTDLHFGASTSISHLETCVALANNLRPDLVVLTGDLIQVSRFAAEDKLSVLFSWKRRDWLEYKRKVRDYAVRLSDLFLKISAADGILSVPGNHDHREGLNLLRRSIGSHVSWLVNENKKLQRAGATLGIAGVDDFRRGIIDLEKALGGIERSAVRVLLSHNPDVTTGKDRDFLLQFDLVLCGHTHGGQIKIPGVKVSWTKQKTHFSGLSHHETVPVYVSNGVGYQGIPFRFRAPPEIVCITLHST